MEPMTDLLTVFLGFGIFNTNCAARLTKWQDERQQGWSMKRLGYLPEEIYGYALARFARDRGERSQNGRSTFPLMSACISTNRRRGWRTGRTPGERRSIDQECLQSTPFVLMRKQLTFNSLVI